MLDEGAEKLNASNFFYLFWQNKTEKENYISFYLFINY